MGDFNVENAILNDVGYGFSEVEAYKIMNNLRSFAAVTPGLKKIRFWGKLLGLEQDYFVIEAQPTDASGEADAEDPLFEPQGTGCNTFTYHVWTQLDDPVFVALDNVKPAHIVATNKIRRVLTGRLDAPVVTYPHFPGTERDLLRALIARITSATVLNIKNFLIKNEDVIEENPEFVYPSTKAMSSIDNWIHCTDHLLDIGRCSYLPLDPENEETREEYLAQVAAQAVDPEQSLIRDLSAKEWAGKLMQKRVACVTNLKYP